MDNEMLLDDLKQFIDAKFSQQDASLDDRFEKFEARMDAKMDQKFREELDPVKQTLDELVDFVTEAIDTSNEAHGKQLKNHETRITKLEQKAA
ncbi:MAG TPA: hypothetical protein VFL85_02625 [Candidatus Saccharimonadales bacterium]|nr:hypothetical protein [Candidatus Saccharimonadales bacterium]